MGDMLLTKPDSEFVDAAVVPSSGMSGRLRATMTKQQIDAVVHTRSIVGWPDTIGGLVAPDPIHVITLREEGAFGCLCHFARAAIDFFANGRRALIDTSQAPALGAT